MKRWTPVWKDADGNRFIFPARNTVFEEEHEAQTKAIADFMWMVAWGLSTDAPLAFEMREDGHADIEHVHVEFPRLGWGCLISGPKFEARKAAA